MSSRPPPENPTYQATQLSSENTVRTSFKGDESIWKEIEPKLDNPTVPTEH